jgi:hypothetical protein
MLFWMAARLVTTAHWLSVDLDQMTAPELALGAIVLTGLAGMAWRRRDLTGSWAV